MDEPTKNKKFTDVLQIKSFLKNFQFCKVHAFLLPTAQIENNTSQYSPVYNLFDIIIMSA